MTSLSHSRAKNILQHHFSSSVFTTLLIRQYRRPRAPGSYLSFLNFCVFTSVAHASACKYYCINASHPHPTSYLQRFIKDYLTIYIQRYHQWKWGLLDELSVVQASAHTHRDRTDIHICRPAAKMGIFNPYTPTRGWKG